MSELVGKQSEQFMCEMFNVRTSWQIVALSHRKICSLDIVSFCVLVENSCSLSPDEFFIGPCLIFPQSHFLSSLSFAELKNLPLWWTCHMVQYNRGGGKIGLWESEDFFGQNWKKRKLEKSQNKTLLKEDFKKWKSRQFRGNCQICSEIITNWTFYLQRGNGIIAESCSKLSQI